MIRFANYLLVISNEITTFKNYNKNLCICFSKAKMLFYLAFCCKRYWVHWEVFSFPINKLKTNNLMFDSHLFKVFWKKSALRDNKYILRASNHLLLKERIIKWNWNSTTKLIFYHHFDMKYYLNSLLGEGANCLG